MKEYIMNICLGGWNSLKNECSPKSASPQPGVGNGKAHSTVKATALSTFGQFRILLFERIVRPLSFGTTYRWIQQLQTATLAIIRFASILSTYYREQRQITFGIV